MYKGIGASEGVAIEKAFVFKKADIEIQQNSARTPKEEIKRYEDAVEKFIDETHALVENVRENAGEAEAQILDGHIIMVQDPEITSGIISAIESDFVTAEYACTANFDLFSEIFALMDDEIMSQRAFDLRDIKSRLVKLITGSAGNGIESIREDCILICNDLAPSDTGRMDKSKIKGIITEIGGMTSHTAIISRAMEIPTVLSIEGITDNVKNGDIVAIDGINGHVCVNPNEEELATYELLLDDFKKSKKELEAYKGKPSVSLDGCAVEICANIGGLKDIDGVLSNTAEGIGLFRTEFLFMDTEKLPPEEDQFEVYKKVAQALEDKPVIIRTLDIGGDKDVPYLGLEKEENPFLGYRAIRLCLGDGEMFKVQLRALLRASHYGNIKIMLPMISTLTEVRQAKEIIQEAKEELKKENKPFNEQIPVGIMIETPAASLIADILAKECDFFSIGTNDLTQYTMAVDRGNKKVQYLYSTFDPAVLRSIYQIIKAGKDQGIMVGMCGEGAGDEHMIPFLLGAGLDEFSMTASSVLKARKRISMLDKGKMEKKVQEVLKLSTAQETYEYLRRL